MEDDQLVININVDTSKVSDAFATFQETINNPDFQEAMRRAGEEWQQRTRELVERTRELVERTRESLSRPSLAGAIFGSDEFIRRVAIDAAYRESQRLRSSIRLNPSHWTETIQIEHEDVIYALHSNSQSHSEKSWNHNH